MELLFDYKINTSLKRFVNVIYSITEFKRKVYLCYSLKYCHHVIISKSTRPRSWIGD